MKKLVEAPLLYLRTNVLFPFVTLSVVIKNPRSIQAVQAASSTEEKLIAVVTGKDERAPQVGTLAKIIRLSHRRGKLLVVLTGIERASIVKRDPTALLSSAHPLPLSYGAFSLESEVSRRVSAQISQLQHVLKTKEGSLRTTATTVQGLVTQIYTLAPRIHVSIKDLKTLLLADSAQNLFTIAARLFEQELNFLKLQQKITKRTSASIQKEEHEQWLRHQLASIEKELGELSPQRADITTLKSHLARIPLPEAVRKDVDRQLVILEKLSVYVPEYHIVRAHLEFVSGLPWSGEAKDSLDLREVKAVLDRDHYGREDIKERLLEHFAVLPKEPSSRVTPLCFLGPPGVGKNSFAESIAKAINRPYERLNLAILNDEFDLRGRSKTHLDAAPGAILQAIKKAGVRNPVIILDEIDKIGADSSAGGCLLELLDSALNKNFVDNYLSYPFDLSQVFVIAIANRADTIPDPIYDQLEIFYFNGYTEQEKIAIARQHLLTDQLKEVGVEPSQFEITDSALLQLIRDYTREAGVHRLSRHIGRLTRKAAKDLLTHDKNSISIDVPDIKEIFNKFRYHREPRREILVPGVAAGLAWTEAGGEILYIETVKFPATRELILTGHLGKVMGESAETALSWVISKARTLNLSPERLTEFAVHIHVPAGAIPKDGPSAGLAMLAALTSLFTNCAVDSRFAMTGELTLGGNVLPVGGIKEKLLAAHRDQFFHVILPKDNEKDLEELPPSVRNEMKFYFVKTAEDALHLAIPAVFEKRPESPAPEPKPEEPPPQPQTESPPISSELSH